MSALTKLLRATGRLRRDTSGLALLEFAFILPVVITMSLTGAELTNYITTKMRIGLIALQLADDAARMGTGTQLSAKEISEGDISDLFTGAALQSGELDLQTNGRVILTDLEEDPDNAGKYKIGWRRCYGNKTAYVRQYPTSSGTTNLTGIGPAGRQVTAQDDNATMFVEVFYTYKPIVGLGKLAPTTTFTEIASMAVRDRRDLAAGVNPATGVTYPVC